MMMLMMMMIMMMMLMIMMMIMMMMMVMMMMMAMMMIMKVALMNLPGYVQCPVVLVAALGVYSELGRLHCHRKHLEEADKYFLKVVTASSGSEAGPLPYSLQVILPDEFTFFQALI